MNGEIRLHPLSLIQESATNQPKQEIIWKNEEKENIEKKIPLSTGTTQKKEILILAQHAQSLSPSFCFFFLSLSLSLSSLSSLFLFSSLYFLSPLFLTAEDPEKVGATILPCVLLGS